MTNFFNKFNKISVLSLLLVFALGWQLGHWNLAFSWQNYKPDVKFTNASPPDDKQDIDFKLFWDTWNLVTKEYVDKKAIDPQKMYYGAIQGMVSAIGDPYTVFLPPESQKSTKEELGGSFEGVGIQLGYNKDKRLVVQSPLSGTPADRAGILAGDLILKINEKDTQGLSLPDAVSLIRGEKNSKVDLEIYREGEEKPRVVTLMRDTIVVKSVEFEEKETTTGKKVSYIKLSRFGDRTFKEWDEAVSKALASGSVGVILDVRNNPGGYLDGARYIGSEFVEKSVIYQVEDSSGKKEKFLTNRVGKLTKVPLVILMNKGSASASEIVSGAMQDLNRAKLVGDQSFGKGTIQETQDLPNGTGIHITTAKWLTPNERWVHNEGLTPDVKIENVVDPDKKEGDEEKDEQLEKALEQFN